MRFRMAAAAALLALAMLALPAESSGDSSSPTWEGVWDTDFGEMTLDAGGGGSYEGFSPGTVSGPADGRVNEGRWQQSDRGGPYKFTMSGDGLSFTGVWSYDQGGCGSACGWNGTCRSGPCRENDDPPPAQPRPCGTPAMHALVAAKTCDLGSLPFGSEFSVPGPRRGQTVDISPKPVRASADEVLAAIRELLLEEEEQEILVSLAIDLGEGASEDFKGCLLFGETFVLGSKPSVNSEQRSALLRACARLVKNEATRIVQGSVAGAGCEAIFVPVFREGQKVTKRKRRRAVANARERLAASCKQRRVGRLSIAVRARGRQATLSETTGRRLHVKVARRVPRGAPEQRLGVRWRAPRR